MASFPLKSGLVTVVSVSLALWGASTLSAGNKAKTFLAKPGIDPNAPQVTLFDGMENGSIEAKMIPQNSLAGNLLIQNKTDQPLNVQLPDSIVGVQVLKQFGGGGGGQGVGGGGGGFGGGGGGGFGGGGGGGFFSIPPDQTARIPYKSVCLEHGKAEPNPRMTYKPIPVEEFSTDPRLQSLLALISHGEIDSQVAQAAAWHFSDEMSWEELAKKEQKHLGGRPSTPYFSADDLKAAQVLVSRAVAAANDADSENEEAAPAEQPKRSRVDKVTLAE